MRFEVLVQCLDRQVVKVNLHGHISFDTSTRQTITKTGKKMPRRFAHRLPGSAAHLYLDLTLRLFFALPFDTDGLWLSSLCSGRCMGSGKGGRGWRLCCGRG